jgi:dipeptidyl aminopeptidase/acylaminoacyl peptidase
LAELSQVSQNSAYTSYLTSYTSDGLKINGFLTIPSGEKPDNGWPGIVFVHGYIPPESYKTLEKYQDYVNYLARNGFVVFKIDLRGHGDSEGCVCGAYYSPDYVIDTLNAYRALQNSDFVDSQKVGLWGHSMAGNIVFRSLVIEKEIPAVVIWAGAVYSYEDFDKYRISDNSYRPPAETSENVKRRERLFDTYGRFDPESSFWPQVVPTNYLEGVSGSIQIHHAVNDNVVDIGYSRDLVKSLEGSAIETDLREYSSGGHNITGSSFTQAMSSTVDFFEDKFAR